MTSLMKALLLTLEFYSLHGFMAICTLYEPAYVWLKVTKYWPHLHPLLIDTSPSKPVLVILIQSVGTHQVYLLPFYTLKVNNPVLF